MKIRTLILALIPLVAACAHMGPSSSTNGPQGKLFIDDGGRGGKTPILFVHGNGANLTQWRAQLDHVRKTRRAVAFDLRGMGESEPAANGDYSVQGFAEDIGTVADALHLQRFILVGHSFGGSVVAAYAAKHPERVAGVVFADSAGNVKMSDEAASKFYAALMKDKDRVVNQWFESILRNAGDAVKTAVLSSVSRTDAHVFADALNGTRSFDMGAALESYRGPRIAIVSSSIEGPGSLHIQFPSQPVRKMEGVSHWLMMDRPEEFNGYLDEFLASVR